MYGSSWDGSQKKYDEFILGPVKATFRKDEIIMIVTDALDGCEGKHGTEIRTFINIVFDRNPDVALWVFVTSRPEQHVSEAFENHDHFLFRLHDIEDHIIQADCPLPE